MVLGGVREREWVCGEEELVFVRGGAVGVCVGRGSEWVCAEEQ